MRHAIIRFYSELLDYLGIPVPEYDWETSVYGIVKEDIPKDCPEPLGKEVVLTSFVDANLYHDFTTGRAVTGILHLVNQTRIEWYTKRQLTVETATYGSEFMAARTATEKIMDLRITLHYLGVPMYGSPTCLRTIKLW